MNLVIRFCILPGTRNPEPPKIFGNFKYLWLVFFRIVNPDRSDADKILVYYIKFVKICTREIFVFYEALFSGCRRS